MQIFVFYVIFTVCVININVQFLTIMKHMSDESSTTCLVRKL